MDGDRSDVVRVRLKRSDLLRGVVVVDTQLKVVGTADNPVFPRNKSTGSDGDIGKFKGLDDLLRLVGPDVDVACRSSAMASQHPTRDLPL